MSDYQLYYGDCLDVMKSIADKSVDLVLTGPPYGTTHCPWDTLFSLEDMWDQVNRVLKPNGAAIVFSQLPFTVDVINANRRNFRYEWVWEKSVGTGFLNAKKMPLKVHENILVFYSKLPTYNPQMSEGKSYINRSGKAGKCYSPYSAGIPTINPGYRYPRDIIRSGLDLQCSIKKRYHSTQKPTPLLEYLIKTYSNQGETVLDCFMGSGSTGVAAINQRRKFIGIEKNAYYFRVASDRLTEAQQNEGFKNE